MQTSILDGYGINIVLKVLLSFLDGRNVIELTIEEAPTIDELLPSMNPKLPCRCRPGRKPRLVKRHTKLIPAQEASVAS
jgi:hypothetical protein